VADAAVVADFNIRLAAETEELRLDPATVRAGVERILGDPSKGRYFLAEVEHMVAGQLMITYEWSDWRNGDIWWLQSVYVKPEFRRRGVFSALYADLVRRAGQNREVCSLRLYMHSANRRARQAYESLGMGRTHYEVYEMNLGKGVPAGG
jgi:GNAT superfamily N-acetyltransferase